MAEFRIRYYYQSQGSSSWTSSSTSISFQNENPSAIELKTIVMAQNRNYQDVRLISVEKRGGSKVCFSVRYHYKRDERGGSGTSSSTSVYWYNEYPSMADIEALLFGYDKGYYSVSIDEVRKR